MVMKNRTSWEMMRHIWTGGVPQALALLGLGGPTLGFAGNWTLRGTALLSCPV